ncbi:chromosome segregation protein SMC [Novimethylophilus kurashikiensis]|uniref:chromosome segregation protein SMC n=1 Tax=Novimethylophilus kurashikiensis TaxID=1825523 RepID=UPI000D5968FC
MRLTHLKLAGFKSFVDPTTLHLHGQRVGIVGPNGCGKSNVMEAIRWVLGESSARELRGDSMQDVIFNGSLNRKPVSRASVELHFDNSLGGAAGQWSQYAEIVVKRVLERDGNSSYIINNQQVRRRDITDLFMGTGVGTRASYAIIGQNTISRIVEAKPEEMRVFLEEAAGVSKYKERRRETELRLRDTRENLVRIDDIRRELEKQITLLESQAEVAQHYHALKQQLDTVNQLTWLLKKRHAAGEWEKAKRRVDAGVNELEAETAALRQAERELEQIRLQHTEHSDTLQQAQVALYEASAALSNVEQQLRHAQETVDRADARHRDLSAQRERAAGQEQEREAELHRQESMQQEAEQRCIATQAFLETSRQALPEREAQQRAAQQAMGAAQSSLAKAEQALQVGLANLQHQRRQLDQHLQRKQRLETEKRSVVLPDIGMLTAKENQLQQAQQQAAALETSIATLQEQESNAQTQLQQAQQAMHEQSRRIAQLEAQLGTLRKIQQAVGGDAKLGDWLNRHDLSRHSRFWQSVRVESGWETAVESVLGERLNALLLDTLAKIEHLSQPPAPFVFCAPAPAATRDDYGNGLTRLATLVTPLADDIGVIVHDWLAGVYVCDSHLEALQHRDQLRDGEWLATRDGHLVSRTSTRLYAPGSALSGVLERQRELEMLEQQLPTQQGALAEAEQALRTLQDSLTQTRRDLNDQRQSHRQASQQQHNLTMEVQRLRQQRQHAEERLMQFSRELQELAGQIEEGEAQLLATQTGNAEQEETLRRLRQERDEKRNALTEADRTLSQARDVLRQAEHNARDAEFSRNTIINKINEIKNTLKVLNEQKSGLDSQLQEALSQRGAHDLVALKHMLESAVETRRQREESLAEARNAMAGVENQQLDVDRRRMQSEHALHPLRDKLEQSRLAEQEARLHFEHCAEALSGVDELALEPMLDKAARTLDMLRRAEDLQRQIDALGAVNLAAIEQLVSERERAGYLDAQAQDLNAAIETLEEAIRRIDRETRSRLQVTFEEVNRNFAELFTVLFNGGNARLELLGDEILDTGIQVFAQPPGKKNSTIHLLSGGEKALTALALVFALFRLNPAPFCLMDEVDAPLDDSNTERFCAMVKKMSEFTQFVFISHNKIAMEMAQQLVGVTMQESGVSRVVEVDVEEAMRMAEAA